MPPSAYSADQLSTYLDLIEFPAKYRPEANPPRDHTLLHALHVHHLSTIPYENLLLHYSKARTVSIDPQALYDKIVSLGRGRGGYCMENCIFYNHILRAMGFDAYHTGGRIRYRVDGVPQGEFMGWSHIVNIVALADGSKYMVDVSFGGDGATAPIPLIANAPQTNLGSQEIRLIWDSLPGQVSSASKSWIYQYRNGADKPWNSYYSFNEVEWLSRDFVASNFYVSTAEDSFQRHLMLTIKFLREGERIVGKRMLGGHVIKENTGGKTRILKECRNEAERIEGLRDLFGIELTDEEIQSIYGYHTQITGE